MKADISWIPVATAGRLAILPRPRAGDWLEDEIQAWRLAGVDYVVSLLTAAEIVELGLQAEPQICQTQALGYLSYPIPDRHIPASLIATQQVVGMINQELQASRSVVIHCRQGIGRAALLAACVLVVHGREPEKAFEQLSQARGVTVPETAEQRQWVVAFSSYLRSAK